MGSTIDVLLNAGNKNKTTRIQYTNYGTSGNKLPCCVLLDAGTNGNQVCISLPMPNQIMSMDKPLWEMEEYDSDPSFMDQLHSGQGLGTVWRNAVEKLNQRFNVFGHKITNYMTDEAFDRYARHKSGVLNTPLREMVFKGVDFRTISLNWVLIPLSEEDSSILSRAIREIQRWALPNTLTERSFSTGLLGYPLLWRVIFMENNDLTWMTRYGGGNYNEEEVYEQVYTQNNYRINRYGGQKVGMPLASPHLPVFKDVAITNISMDYTGAGKAVFHKKNAPVQVNLSIQFAETTIHTANDVENGFHL